MKPVPKHEQPTRFAGPSAPETGPLRIDTPAGSVRCQVRTGTDSPCGRPAVTEVLDVPFCGLCAREQEDYFVVGELMQVPRGRRVGTTSLGNADTGMRRPPAPAGRRRRFRETVVTGGRVPYLLVVLVLASALASAACGGPEQARADSDATDPRAEQARGAKEHPPTAEVIAGAGGNAANRADARAGDAEVRAGGAVALADNAKAVAGDAEARAGNTLVVGDIGKDAPDGDIEGKDGPAKVTLSITGDPGTRFSGACSVGGHERALDGQAPERYAFNPDGKKLECEVRTEGGGGLGIVFADGEGVRSEQRTGAGQSTVGFVYSGGSIASSTSSVSVPRAVTSSDGASSGDSP